MVPRLGDVDLEVLGQTPLAREPPESWVFGSAQSRPIMQIGMAAASISAALPGATAPRSASKPTMKPATTNIPAA
jgi:hypothetical protein